MNLQIDDRTIETNEQGFLTDPNQWSEQFAEALAEKDDIQLYADHWELIWYFRDYFDENQMNPTMHTMVRTLGKHKGEHFREQKAYEKHIYGLFNKDPVHEVCKLAGLPMPPPDT